MKRSAVRERVRGWVWRSYVVCGDWEWPWVMTPHLGTSWLGASELLYVINQSSWALDMRWPGVHHGCTAVRTSNNLSFHGDAERQWKKAGIKVTWVSPELPTSQLSRKQPFISFPLFLCSWHSNFPDILKCRTWINQDLLYLDTSWSSFLEDSIPPWLAYLFSSSRFHLNYIIFGKSFSWCLSVSCLAHSL